MRARDPQPDAREGQAGPLGVAERSVVPAKPGNAGWREGALVQGQRHNVTDIQEIGVSLLPPIKVGKLQTALHTKAKNSPGYRFYALYDKLYRRDILEWAFVRCRQ